MFYVKTATNNDIPGILEIEKSVYPRPWDEKAFECELSKSKADSCVFLVARKEDDDKVIGYATGDVSVDYIHISNVGVHDEFRRKGIAAVFIRKMEQEALRRKLRSLTLEVRENNEPAVSLYRKLGFEVKGKREKYYENKHDGFLMWKSL